MALVTEILTGATSIGVGPVHTFDKPTEVLGFQVNSTGAPDNFAVSFEGSIDGVNFVQIGGASGNPGAGGNANVLVASVAAVIVAIRANVTVLSGGTSPTISVFVAIPK